VFVSISSTKTKVRASSVWATITLQPARRHSSRSTTPTLRFLGEAEPLHQPPHGYVAQMRSRYVFQGAPSLADGGGGVLLHVLLEQDRGFPVDLAGTTGALPGHEGIPPKGGPGVTLGRGEAHVEEASGLGFGHVTFYGGDYLLAEVFGVGSHHAMVAYRSSFMHNAV
jgi:hypothetical protein